MKNIIKKYLTFLWHHSQAYTLMTLPLNGVGVFLIALSWLQLRFGVVFPIWAYVLLFVGTVVSLVLAGIWLARQGLIAFYQSLSNKQSPELLMILQKVESIEKQLI